MRIKVWHAQNSLSADWLIEGVALAGRDWETEEIPKPGSAEFLDLPEQLKQILRLDSPDLLVTVHRNERDYAAVSIETTTTTPQSQHAKQRFPRIVAAAEAGVPSVYIIARKKRAGDGAVYLLGKDLSFGMNRVSKLNAVPALVHHWPDDDGALQMDATFPGQPDLTKADTISAFNSIRACIIAAEKDDTRSLSTHPWIKKMLARQRVDGNASNLDVENYTTLTLIETDDLNEFLLENTEIGKVKLKKTLDELPHRIFTRGKTLIFRPAGRLFEHAGDPYVGMLSFFDYAFCRTGRGVEDRSVNLVHMPVKEGVSRLSDEFAPEGYHQYWKSSCAFRVSEKPTPAQLYQISHHLQYGCVYTKKKPLRILGYFSDLIVFQDAILPF